MDGGQQPYTAARDMAFTSSGTVISSTAMTWGFMARSTRGMPRALGQASSTSVRGPTSIWGLPRYITATSPRSSMMATRRGPYGSTPSDSRRTRSRSRVVLPPPGGDKIRVLQSSPSRNSSGARPSAIPGCCRAMRTAAEQKSFSVVLTPFFITAVPHSPTRKPPRTERYPSRRVSAAA